MHSANQYLTVRFPVFFSIFYCGISGIIHNGTPEYANTLFDITNTSVRLGSSTGGSKMCIAIGI